ncbi:MAG: rhodanese-like domain-containing protein [Bacteroidota bacterium]
MKNSILFLVLCLFFACQSNSADSSAAQAASSNSASSTYAKLDPAQFAAKLEETKGQLVDVRTRKEYVAGHIEGSVNMDFHGSKFEEQLLQLDKEKPVFVYCKSGGRSGKTGNRLKSLGFKEIYDLDGGYKSWLKNTQ